MAAETIRGKDDMCAPPSLSREWVQRIGNRTSRKTPRNSRCLGSGFGCMPWLPSPTQVLKEDRWPTVTAVGVTDRVNHMIGGCAAGTLFGMKHGSVKMGAIACPLFAFTTAMVDLSGETFRGGREQFVQKNPMVYTPWILHDPSSLGCIYNSPSLRCEGRGRFELNGSGGMLLARTAVRCGGEEGRWALGAGAWSQGLVH